MSVLLITVLISILLYVDADTLREINSTLYSAEIRRSPVFWGIAGFFLFILAAPIYLLRRFQFVRAEAAFPVSPEASVDSHRNARILSRTALVILVWFSINQIVGMAIFPSLIFATHWKFNLTQGVISSIVGSLVFLAVALAMRDRRQGVGNALFLIRPARRSALILWSSFLLGATMAVLFIFIMNRRTTHPSTPIVSGLQTSSSMVVLGFILFGSMIGPLFEEVIFRGYVFEVIERFKGRALALTGVTIIFAAMHFDQTKGDWLAFLMVTVLALVLTWLRASTGSIVPGVIAHYTYNILLFALPISMLMASDPSFAIYELIRDRISVDRQITLLRRSVERRPDSGRANNELAWVLAEADRNLPEALSLVDTALKKHPENLGYQDTRAEVLFKLKRIDEAIAIESEIVGKAPKALVFSNRLKKFRSAR